jgi:hypothetical protein
MALGSAYLFGLKLPLNFNSPLKACSITDFWRRWHMTMTRFFTDYLYSTIALPMMRRAMRKSYRRLARFLLAVAMPITATFVLAGLWHGAGWTFVVFGLIHGLALAINHAWREAGMRALPPVAAWLLTMAVVVTGLVFFRAADVATALALLASMLGMAPAEAVGGAASTHLARIAADPSAALAWIVALGTIALGHRTARHRRGARTPRSDPRTRRAARCAHGRADAHRPPPRPPAQQKRTLTRVRLGRVRGRAEIMSCSSPRQASQYLTRVRRPDVRRVAGS